MHKRKAMRKVLLPILIAAGFLFTTGCEIININEEYWIVDWSPVNIYITATDAEGNSIISPEMPGMSLTFKGETYTVKEWGPYGPHDPEYQTRAYLAILYGLYAQPYTDGSGQSSYRLYFGEIDGAADMDEDIVLKWPDGSSDTIHYHYSDHREGRNPKCNRSWRLNGQKHDGSTFHFTGKSL